MDQSRHGGWLLPAARVVEKVAGEGRTPVFVDAEEVAVLEMGRYVCFESGGQAGISQVPALTLGRPAAIFDLAVKKGDPGFEPQFRFGLDGKPWSFLLWGRYRVVTGEKFRLTVGAHPAFSFRATPASINGAPRDVIEVRRYPSAEVSPTYALSSTLSVGAYYFL